MLKKLNSLKYLNIYRVIFLLSTLVIIQFLGTAQESNTTEFNSEEASQLNIKLMGHVKYVSEVIQNIEFETKEELEYSFGINGLPTKIIHKSLEFDPVVGNLRKKETEFDFKNGSLTSKLNTKVSGLDGCLFDLDDNGNTIGKRYYFYNCLTSEEVFDFDESSRLVKSSKYNYVFSQKSNNEKLSKKSKYLSMFETFEYDERGNVIIKTLNNVKGKVYKKYGYTYDSVGNKIEDSWIQDYKNNKSKEFSPLHGYKYNEKGELILKYCIADFSPHNTNTYYDYDDKGNQVDVKGYYIKKDTVLGYHYKYQFDKYGNETSEVQVVGNYRRLGIDSYKTHITQYDHYQNVILEEFLNKYGTTVKVVLSKYTFDKRGNWIELVKEEGKNFDELVKVEQTKRVIKYYN